MPKGFFNLLTTTPTKKPLSKIPSCGACQLYKKCNSPKMPVRGKGKKRIMIVGECPGTSEDLHNKPFIGPAGQRLQEELRYNGIELFRDCWVTNSLICAPGKVTPTDKQVQWCRPNVFNAINEYKPDVIILLGGVAVKSVIGQLWEGNINTISTWVGMQIPSQELNCWLAPTFHPSYLLRQQDPVLDLHFAKHLQAALTLEGKPWPKGPPNFAQRVSVLINPVEAAAAIRKLMRQNPPLAAIDLECNGLKPDSDKISIYSCSISDGKTTLSYPWQGDAITATKELISSDIPLTGWNIKYEQRMFMRAFGHGVKNWKWDGMLAAHIADNRPDVTSLKFQAFVKLGMPSYDQHIKPYFQSKGSNLPNRIKELDLHQLLTYGAIDAILEYKLAKMQMKELEEMANV